MPTAPAYQTYTRISTEPFFQNGKYFIIVKNEKTKISRIVRWYSESEYAKLYGKRNDDSIPNMKHKYGFGKGPILIVRYNQLGDEEYLRQSGARYILGIGWYYPSTAVLPIDAPANFMYLLLGWDELKRDETHMKPTAEIAKILDMKAKKGQWIKFI